MSFGGLCALGSNALPRRQEESLCRAISRSTDQRRIQLVRRPRAVFVGLGTPVIGGERGLFVCSSRIERPNEAGEAEDQDSAAICRAFESRGDDGIAGLLGAFALADWDEQSGTLTLARDCIGGRSVFYHVGDGFVAFASNLASLLALPDVPRELDERLLANFVALNHREREATFYRGICRVPSRTVVRIDNARIAQRRYWEPKRVVGLARGSREGDYIVRARELFDQAVARTLRRAPRSALLLSGGLDSSAIAATAVRLGLSDITCYTGVPPEHLDVPTSRGWYLDERSKIAALTRVYPSLRTKLITPRGANLRQSEPQRYFPAWPIPHRGVANLGWFGAITDAVVADGHGVTVSGMAGNFALSWGGSFSLAALLGEGRLPRLFSEARAVAGNEQKSVVRVLIGEAVLPHFSARVHDWIALLRGMAPWDIRRNTLLRPEIVEAFDLQRQWREDGYDPARRLIGDSVQFRIHHLFDHGQLTRDHIAMQFEVEGLDTVSPYHDRALIEFCLSVPEPLYRRHGIRRWFARQVFADRLPPEILNETRHGEQAPNWFESLDARKPIIVQEVERLESSRLASRLIDLPRLKRLIAEWPKDAREAQARVTEFRYALDRAVHVGQFIRWIERGNA